MDMSNQFEPLKQQEIISVKDSVNILLSQPTYKVSEFTEEMMERINSYMTDEQANWFSEGVKCEVLKLDGKGWQKGKVRLALEFCPDEPEVEETPENKGIVEPESPLDDLRQMVN